MGSPEGDIIVIEVTIELLKKKRKKEEGFRKKQN